MRIVDFPLMMGVCVSVQRCSARSLLSTVSLLVCFNEKKNVVSNTTQTKQFVSRWST